MENTIVSLETTTTTTTTILSLNQVDWKPNYVLSKASIGQIMVCFSKILNVVPKNVYEVKLYEKLKPSTETLLNEFNKLLTYTESKDKDIKFYNLIVNMPKNVSVNDAQDGLIKLRNAKIGSLIKAIKQRITFMVEREIPERYAVDQEMLQGFIKLRSEVSGYLNKVNEYEEDFVDAIDEAHKIQQNFYNQ